MEKVLGIGGFFFRAKNPEALSQWYHQHLGITPIPTSYDQSPWQQASGATAFAPFPADTKYFGAESQTWMINFRVANLEAMVAQLREAGIEVEVDTAEYPNGWFARLTDPEGNPIELWQAK
jgi:glyoxylase I family protein